jgi:alcohol dehydrogenase (cytochrome c)
VATLSTGGGLVFSGNIDRTVFALDAKTGDVLWQQRVNTTPAGFPITYEAGGKQYVAFPVGAGAWPPRAFNVLAPEITFPDGGSTLWVFALPDGM